MKTLKNTIFSILLIITVLATASCKIVFKSEEKDIVNKISEQNIITANVSIRSYTPNSPEFESGSAVIVSKQQILNSSLFEYYVLTNYHVVKNSTIHKVFDCYGDEYDSTVIFTKESYDLALVSFKSRREYVKLNILAENQNKGTKIISMGDPLRKKNTITFGEIDEYKEISVEGEVGENGIDFKVVCHTAPISSGSSGGAVMDYEFRICALNFAGARNDDGEFVKGYAIPCEKIVEFINESQIQLV